MILLHSILDGIADIKDHVGRTFLQLVGIILGAGSIVATFALAASGKEASQEYYKVSGGVERIWISNKASGKVERDAKLANSDGLTYGDALTIRREAKEIDLVSPVVEESMLIRAGRIEKTRNVMGVTAAYSPMNDFRAEQGRFITDNDVAQASRVVVLGVDRKRELFGNDNAVGKTIVMNGVGYHVIGVMQEKYFSFDGRRNILRWMNRQIYIPVTTLVTRRGDTLKSGKIAWMHARMRDVTRHEEAVEELEKILQREHGVKDFQVFSRVANLKRNAEQGKMYDLTFMICGLISLIVGGIVVMNIQLASFNERVREVGVRKAIGANGLQIFGQFIVESVLVSSIGGVLGIFIGKAFTTAITSMTGNPAYITPQVVVIALLFAAGTGFIFGIYPAIRASRLNPIEALRVE